MSGIIESVLGALAALLIVIGQSAVLASSLESPRGTAASLRVFYADVSPARSTGAAAHGAGSRLAAHAPSV